MFGKSFAEYLRFQKWVLLLIVTTWALRFGLSLAGAAGSSLFSVTWVLVLGAIYYGVVVGVKGFGGYRHLYVLNLAQSLLAETLVALGIAISILTGRENIFTFPEFSVGVVGMSWMHVVAHILVPGAIVLPLLGWALSAIVMSVTRLLSPTPGRT